MTKKRRKNMIIARGEITDHAHVVIGEAEVIHNNDEILIEVYGKAAIKHILETPWIEENIEVWTKEHTDIELVPGKYHYVPQIEYDPYDDAIRVVQD